MTNALENGRIILNKVILDFVDFAQIERGVKLTMKDNNNVARFLLTFFLGWIGSIIINNTSLKPEGYTSRTGAYLGLGIITCGIYSLVAAIFNLTFDPAKVSNVGYRKD